MSKKENPFTIEFLKTLPWYENDTDEELMETIRLIENPKNESLTLDKFRTFPGCEHYTDEEAEEIISSLEQFCHILLDTTLDLEKIGAYDKDGNIMEDHPELVKRRAPVFSEHTEHKRGPKKRTDRD